MSERISIPKNYEVEDCSIEVIKEIPTKDKNNKDNGCIYPIVNTLVPGTLPINLVYFTYCKPGMVKGPHMHLPPKYDRFICTDGGCVIIVRNEQTGKISKFHLGNVYSSTEDMLTIPPYNSHAIVSREGCYVLSICNEGYYPGHYNQIETEYEGYDWKQWLK